MKFWDSSAIIPLCLHEPSSPTFKSLLEKDTALVAWWGTLIECFSAFARLRRDEIHSRKDEDHARRLLMSLSREWTEIEPSQEMREEAARLISIHPLRAADALQLASAKIWCEGRPTHYHFVCQDNRLRDAAQKEGFIVLPE